MRTVSYDHDARIVGSYARERPHEKIEILSLRDYACTADKKQVAIYAELRR